MKKNSLVSVIVPVYKVEECLPKCVRSICNQTYANLEIILVDDGSPDLCGQMCDEYAASDSRIRVIHKENGGLSDARNAGMRIATGEYLMFVDSDDFLTLSCIEIMMKEQETGGSDIVICAANRICNREAVEPEPIYEASHYSSDEAFLSMLYGIPFSTSAWGKLFKRPLFDGIEFPYGKLYEDLFTIYKTILRAEKVTYISYPGYFYFYRTGSITVTSYSARHLDSLDAVNSIRDSCKFTDSRFSKALSNEYINVVYDVAAKNPSLDEYCIPPLRAALKENRVSVLFDGRAPKRLRAFALLSYLGPKITLLIIPVRNRKWKKI